MPFSTRRWRLALALLGIASLALVPGCDDGDDSSETDYPETEMTPPGGGNDTVSSSDTDAIIQDLEQALAEAQNPSLEDIPTDTCEGAVMVAGLILSKPGYEPIQLPETISCPLDELIEGERTPTSSLEVDAAQRRRLITLAASYENAPLHTPFRQRVLDYFGRLIQVAR